MKKVVANPDGSYSVIEYPADKEVVVTLLPRDGVSSTGTARVMRTAAGTKVFFDVAGAPADWKNVYAYAVDPTGSTTLLGPIEVAGGVGKAEFTTPMDKFMLVVSPAGDLTNYSPTTTYVFRSEVPKGYAIVPRAITDTTKAVASSQPVASSTDTTKVVASSQPVASSTDTTKVVASSQPVASSYEVPMLGVPKFSGKTTEVRVNFKGDLQGLEGKAYLKPKGGKTTIKMRFADMRKAPLNKRFVLWASAPDGSYTKLGQVINNGTRDEAEIRSETAMADFGLMLTLEDVDVDKPTSTIYSPFTVITRPL
ncbi:MAG: hypothetical protein H0X08_05195 [Blastocatellia bacterium]|nr:hypothetical protein [Blastocatellia bacterium]